MSDSSTLPTPAEENPTDDSNPEPQPEPLDLNTASIEQLTTITGIGPALAERIIAGRPYPDVEALTEVQGISTVMLDSIRERVTVLSAGNVPDLAPEEAAPSEPEEALAAPEAEPELPEEEDTAQLAAVEQVEAAPETTPAAPSPGPDEQRISEPMAEDMPVEQYPGEMFAAQAAQGQPEQAASEPETTSPPPTEAPQPAARPSAPPPPAATGRSQGVSGCSLTLIAMATGLVAILLAVALSLGILGAVNGSLRYVQPAELADVRGDFQSLQAQSSTLTGEVEALRQRLDNLEALSGRVSQVEETTADLQSQIDSLNQELETASQQLESMDNELTTLSDEVQALESEVAGLRSSTNRFEDFLGGLGQLLRRLGIPLPESNTP